MLIDVYASRDENGVWFVEETNLPGLHVDARSFDDLFARLPGAVRELLEADGKAGFVQIDCFAHETIRMQAGAA